MFIQLQVFLLLYIFLNQNNIASSSSSSTWASIMCKQISIVLSQLNCQVAFNEMRSYAIDLHHSQYETQHKLFNMHPARHCLWLACEKKRHAKAHSMNIFCALCVRVLIWICNHEPKSQISMYVIIYYKKLKKINR